MAPDLPPPVRGGVNLLALRDAKVNAEFEFPEIQQAFFLQDGIYVVRPCDPLRLGHVLWGKLAFCDFTHRLLIRFGCLPEIDPRSILVGMRTSLNALPDQGPYLKSIVERLDLPSETQAFRFYAKQLGMVGTAKLLLHCVTEDDIREREVQKGIDEAVHAVSSAARGLTQSDLDKIRFDARKHFGVARASFALTEGAPALRPLSPERIRQLRRAADAPIDTSSCPDVSAIHEKVSQLSVASVKAANTAALRLVLIDFKLPTEDIAATRALVEQHLREAETAPEMSARVMTRAELEAFARRVADSRRIKILKEHWKIDEQLARHILQKAQANGQYQNLLSSTTTGQEDAAVGSMPWPAPGLKAQSLASEAVTQQRLEDRIAFIRALKELTATAATATVGTADTDRKLFLKLKPAVDAWSKLSDEPETEIQQLLTSRGKSILTLYGPFDAASIQHLAAVLGELPLLWQGLNTDKVGKQPKGRQMKAMLTGLTQLVQNAAGIMRSDPSAGPRSPKSKLKDLPDDLQSAMRDYFNVHTVRSKLRSLFQHSQGQAS